MRHAFKKLWLGRIDFCLEVVNAFDELLHVGSGVYEIQRPFRPEQAERDTAAPSCATPKTVTFAAYGTFRVHSA